MRTITGAAVAVLLSGLAGTAAQTQTLAVALVGENGIMVPAAVFEGAQWVSAWPEPSDPESLIGMLKGLPPTYWGRNGIQRPDRWFLAQRNAAQPRPLKVLANVIYQEHCGYQVGLLTDMAPRRSESNERFLAADAPVAVQWPVLTRPTGALEKLIVREVLKQEERAILDWESHLRQRSELEPLALRRPIAIRAIYLHSGTLGRTTYYEAQRNYAKPVRSAPTAQPVILMATGWIHESPAGEISALDTRAVLIGPRHKDSGTMRPLGMISLAGADYWFGQVMGYESEALSIVRVDATSVRKAHEVVIGGC